MKTDLIKTKVAFLLLILISVLSCSKSDGCDENSKVVLTESNYIFEGDLYKLFLNHQIDSLTARQNVLQEIIDNNQGNEETTEDLASTVSLKKETIAIDLSIPDLESLISKFAIRIPPRVGPRPGVTPSDLVYIAFYGLKEYNGVVFDVNNKIIGQTSETAKLVKDSDDKLYAVKIDLSEIFRSGSYHLKSKRIDLSGNQASYTNELSVNEK